MFNIIMHTNHLISIKSKYFIRCAFFVFICSLLISPSNGLSILDNNTSVSALNETTTNMSNSTIINTTNVSLKDKPTNDDTNISLNNEINNNNTNISLNTEKINYKTNILFQIMQFLTFALALYFAIAIALYQMFEPKFHPLLNTLLFDNKNIIFIVVIILVYFGTLTLNFIATPSDMMLTIEFLFLFIAVILLFYLFCRIIKYSNKYILIKEYLNSITNIEIFKEVCMEFGYPQEQKTSESGLLLKSLFATNSEDIDEKYYNSEKKKANESNKQIRKLNENIKNNKEKSDLRSVFDALSIMIEKSDDKIFYQISDEIETVLFPIIKNENYNSYIKNNIAYFLIVNYDRLIKISIDNEKYSVFTSIINAYEKLGKLLIDKNDFDTVKMLVDQLGKHSFDINRKLFHLDYSYKASDSILNLIHYYMDKDAYVDTEVQKWLEIVGAIAEDLINVDYKIKYNSIRIDFTSKTVSDENPVYRIINELKNVNKRVVEKSLDATAKSDNGAAVFETISVILKNAMLKLIKKNDSSVTYEIISVFKEIGTQSINMEIQYSLHYIIKDLFEVGNELILNELKDDAASLLFTIAELGYLAENKQLKTRSQDLFFHRFAKILKELMETYYLKFNEYPYARRQNDLFYELGLSSRGNSDEFENYYLSL